MKIFNRISLFILVFILSVTEVFADGWHVSDRHLHLYEPNQKAVISWDGKTETMILSSAVKSEDIANFAWIVPIQSSIKPEVTAGDISIFEDLVNYFEKKKPYKRSFVKSMGGGVEVLETKEIDVYDITILKATNSDDLIDWLNNNGYKVPENAKPILDKYVKKENFYFVANKIDLNNKFLKEIIEIDSIYKKRKKEYKRICEQITQIFYELGLEDSIYHFDYHNDPKWNTREDFCFLSQRSYPEEKRATSILNKYLNNKLKKKLKEVGLNPDFSIDLGNGLEIISNLEIRTFLRSHWGDYTDSLDYCYCVNGVNRILKNNENITSFDLNRFYGFYPKRRHQGREGLLSRPNTEIKFINRSKKNYIEKRDNYINHSNNGYRRLKKRDKEKLIEFFSLQGQAYNDFINELEIRHKLVKEKIEPIILKMNKSFGNKLGVISNLIQGLFYDGSKDSMWNRITGIFYESNLIGDVEKAQEKYRELYITMGELKRGIGTPLKFEFQPAQPYYPLEISSLNIGESKIEVYVLARRPVTDTNNILQVNKSKKINSKLRKKLKKHINLVKAKYVTRLSFKGDLINLTNDAEFNIE